MESDPRQRNEMEVKDATTAKKIQKAGREKLRRDRLNEHFLELGNVIDPDRPKNDKATILTDAIQMLKDLTSEVSRLKAECAALAEESRELTQEKNELREEKVSLRSDVDNLSVQYQQRVQVTYPWTAVDPSVMMPPPYSFPLALPVPPGSITMHPSVQSFPLFGNQNHGVIPSNCSTFISYSAPANPNTDQLPALFASTSHISNKQDSRSRSPVRCRGSNDEKSDDSNDVITELELKIPGSIPQKELSPDKGKGKQLQKKSKNIADGSSSSRYSSEGVHDSSNNSVADITRSNE